MLVKTKLIWDGMKEGDYIGLSGLTTYKITKTSNMNIFFIIKYIYVNVHYFYTLYTLNYDVI